MPDAHLEAKRSPTHDPLKYLGNYFPCDKLRPMPVREQIIEILADGRFHSGQDLGERLSLTRAAVWKHVRALSDRGLDVQAVRGKGYRLSEPLELLDADGILDALHPWIKNRVAAFEVHAELDSTSDHLKRQPSPGGSDRFNVCFAERQTAGRGRRGRTWVSPFGTNLYGSIAYRADPTGAALDGLSLAVGVALIHALQDAGVAGAGLKWPNDILLGGRKLAGVLIELAGEMDGALNVIVGIGLNVRMPRHAGNAIDQPWTDLHAHGVRVSRNSLAAAVLNRLLDALHRFSRHGLAPFADDWQRFDHIAGRAIDVHTGSNVVTGTALGIDERGALKVEHAGTVIHYHSGEVSLRVAS